jgi:energy-coupling factor transporter ATP-binding protein EcfA2
MKYKYSSLDRDNLKWFANDMSKTTLTEIAIRKGNLRGLSNFNIKFDYPISVIAGKNGSGKSTVLALAACAFHNDSKGFKLPERNTTYYTYSDFFIQTSEEIPPDGIEIWYRFRHNKWKKSKKSPEGIGNLYQKREKKKDGKWTNYSTRVNRNVVFLGIQRVVPHSEKSVSKSYRTYFKIATADGWEDDVKKVVGRILGSVYDTYWMKTHGRYRMPLVAAKGSIYSGFNMGAGENALFEIFTTIYASPPGTMLVVDEIELGLHEKAQKKLISELKKICREKHVQVVCTTHSPAILESVPPEGRFFIESYADYAVVAPGISSKYAAGLLAGEDSNELDVFVEDGIASTIFESALDKELRCRVSILPIGSHVAIARQMASRFKETKRHQCIAILDGDQSSSEKIHVSNFMNALENSKDKEAEENWFKKRLLYLPGDTWPEKWVVVQLKNIDTEELADLFKCSDEELNSYIDEALTSEKHDEIYSLSKSLSLDIENVKGTTASWLARKIEDKFSGIISSIKEHLD